MDQNHKQPQSRHINPDNGQSPGETPQLLDSRSVYSELAPGDPRIMYSPQPRAASPLSSGSAKKLKNNLSQSTPNINFYMSTERRDRYSNLKSNPRTPISSPQTEQKALRNPPQVTRVEALLNHPDEDERFLRLAREALVATATSANLSNSMYVDPTISDLLTRLQYASSPHGNPIKKSSEVEANSNGTLNIQGFYKNFPNLSNDVFTESYPQNNPSQSRHEPSQNHPSVYNEGWNFLIGEPVSIKSPQERESERQAAIASRFKYESDEENDGDDGDTDDVNDPTFGGESRKGSGFDDPSRKFLCNKCSMSFRRSSDLKRHEKQHLSIPPNICALCGKGFARKDALKRHVSTLTCKRNATKKLYVENLNYLRKE